MTKIIYAIKITDLVASGLKIMNVKIGQTINVNSILRQYRRSNLGAEILDVWEVKPEVDIRNLEKESIC